MSTHKAAGGKASQHVSPEGKRLGVKKFAGEKVAKGQVIARQRGTGILAGVGVQAGRDHTLYAMADGMLKYGTKLGRKIISVTSS